jgi:hypothetical protein
VRLSTISRRARIPSRVTEVFGRGDARVDGPSGLRHPQLHPVVGQDWGDEGELVAVEGAFVRADHDRVEVSTWIRRGLQQSCGFGPACPGAPRGAPARPRPPIRSPRRRRRSSVCGRAARRATRSDLVDRRRSSASGRRIALVAALGPPCSR